MGSRNRFGYSTYWQVGVLSLARRILAGPTKRGAGVASADFFVKTHMRVRASGPADCTEISGRGLLTKCCKKVYHKKKLNPFETPRVTGHAAEPGCCIVCQMFVVWQLRPISRSRMLQR